MIGRRKRHQHRRLTGYLHQFALHPVIGKAVSFAAALAYRRPGGAQSTVEMTRVGEGGEIDPWVECDSRKGPVGELVVVRPWLVVPPICHESDLGTVTR